MGQHLHLVIRPCDPQAVKVCIAAAAAGKDLDTLIQLDSNQASASTSTDQAPSSTAAVRVSWGSADELCDTNAVARLVGGQQLVPPAHSLAVDSWLEWEESCLRSAVYGGQASTLAAAVDHLAAAVRGRTHLVASQLTLADVVVYASLLPLQDQLQGEVAQYLAALAALPAVAQGLAAALAGQPPSSVADVFRRQAAALAAAVPRLPVKGERNILITSALPYVNNVPHLGNIIGCVLSADCYARYCRSRGYNSIFVCGTDEYGTATETKALEEGLTCQQICDKYHAIHADIYRWFDIAFDKFGRTPTRHQTEIAQSIFRTLEDADQLVEQEMEQLYSEAAGKFLADRFVTGTCPKCGYQDARGDQCDGCGNLLNPTELLQPKCALTGTTPVLRSTRHLFLDLPKLSPQLQQYIDTTSQLGGWSSNCLQVTKAWMRDGLKVRCITRDLKWGTPVPRPGYDNKVFYVWFDAPIGYISITANYVADWQAWWRNPDDVELVQFMGKDNVPFHTVIFPATLLGTRERWTLMRNISVTEYLNYEGGKFSKSRGVGVFGSDARDTGIPVEVWRYYLLANRPEQSDTDFKWADLAAKNNSELLANLGNFINRTLSFLASRHGGQVPGVAGASSKFGALAAAEALGAVVAPLVAEYTAHMEALKIRAAVATAMRVSAAGNKFLQDNKPWEVVKVDAGESGVLLSACAGLVRLLAALLEPVMPSFARRTAEQLGLPPAAARLSPELLEGAARPHLLLPEGHRLGKPEVLFRTISDAEVETLRARYAGNQSDRAAAATSSTNAAAPAAASRPGGKVAAKAGKHAGNSTGSGSAPAQPSSKPAAAGADGSTRQQPWPASTASSNGPSCVQAPSAKAAASSKKPPEAAERPVDISRLDLRVGRILKAWRHPDAESLYVEDIDVGEPAGPRQVVSGLVKFIPEADMQGRAVVVVANMKPAAMRGIKSHAMVLCATSPDGTKVEFVEPPAGAAPGERVTVAGYDSQPDEVLNPKKKVFEALQPELATNSEAVACWRGQPLTTAHGACCVASIKGGSIK